MSLVLPNPGDWRRYLTNQIPQLVQIGLWGQAEQAMQHGLGLSPAAFIIPGMERPEGNNRTTHGVSQQVTITWGVLLGVRSLRQTAEMMIADELREVRTAVMEALLTWDWEVGQIAYGSGRVLMIQQGVLWWLDEYEFPYYLRVIK